MHILKAKLSLFIWCYCPQSDTG